MGKIATEQEAFEKRDSSKLILAPTEPNKCCTKERADYFGCIINGEYESNQLIQKDDLALQKLRNSITLQQDSTSGGSIIVFRTILKAAFPVTSNLTITVYCEPADGVIGSVGNRDFNMSIGKNSVVLGTVSQVDPAKSRIVSGTPEEDETYKYVYGMVIIG